MDSNPSNRSGWGVPFGVVFVLSTRLCLDPERGVMLFRKVVMGDATSSLSFSLAGPPTRLPNDDSGLCALLGSGVATATDGCCCGVDERVAILGVSGGLLTPRAKVGSGDCCCCCCPLPLKPGALSNGILRLVFVGVAVEGWVFGLCANLIVRVVGAAFWSRSCRGSRRR